ncbi:hypothetical protein EC991_008799 [Linnemannia zychae]|nr:hypothetical protein EC991_008799 [Linnemannia zychae]
MHKEKRARIRLYARVPKTATLVACTLLAFLSSTPSSFAQQEPFFPTPVRSPATARSPTRFYILSGDTGGNDSNIKTIPQFMSLDLTVSWPGSRPVWHRLTGGPMQYIYPAAMSADGQTLIAFRVNPSFAMRYNVATDQWTPSQIKPGHSQLEGVGAVTDSQTGLVYLAAGYTGVRDSMAVYDFKTDTMTTSFLLPRMDTTFMSRAYYANVWSSYRKTIFYFGGYNTTLDRIGTDNVLTEFDPATNIMSTVAASGPSPPMRADHCMASNDDGTLIVIYGGRIQGRTYGNDIYVYNVVTHTWQAGPPGMFRLYSACTIAGNQLLVWGGLDENTMVVDSTVLVFNLDSMTWTDHYNARVANARLPQPSGGTTVPASGDINSNDKRPSLGVIVGASVGGLALIMAVALLSYFIHRRKNRPQGAALLSSRADDDDPDRKRGGAYPEETTRNDEELQHLRVQLQAQQEELELHRRLLQLQQEQQQLQQQQQLLQLQQRPVSQYVQQTQPYQGSSIYTAPAVNHDPFRNINSVYSQDSKNTLSTAGSSTLTTAADLYYQHPHYQQQQLQQHSPMIPSNSPPIYAAHPYQPHVLVPSPTPSHTLITSTVIPSATNSSVPSRVNSFSATSYNNGEGSSSSMGDNQPTRGYKSGAPSNPQFGARER